jgi:hypothetical protein
MPLKCVIQSLNILSTFPQFKEGCISKHSLKEVINKDLPWDFFYGASQGSPPKVGQGEFYIYPPLTTSLLRLDWATTQITSVNSWL